MASIRRTLSPVPRAGVPMNGETCPVSSSPLSKSSLSNPNHPTHSLNFPSSIASLDYALFRAQDCLLGFISHRRPLERSKLRGQIWKRSILHYFSCFILGVFLGFTPFLSPILSFQTLQKDETVNDPSLELENLAIVDNSTLELHTKVSIAVDGNGNSAPPNQTMDFHKLLIVVTSTEPRPFQAYYINHIAHTLKRVPPPLLWIVVEMNSQSLGTADMLRRSGVMYRHLVCSDKNVTEVKERRVHMRNTALSHIETHRLDGIVYFADDDKTYSLELFEEMREIRRFGAWPVPRMAANNRHVLLEGPVCKGAKVLGWHTNDVRKRIRRFHVEVSGFAFNSTILWDPKRWHRPTLQPIRLIDGLRDGFQATTFIEQLVEDENQMEGIPPNCSRVMLWQFDIESSYPKYPSSSSSSIKNHSKTATATTLV
ncbi:hypothetical protein DM860_007692 [Cuscuta australis]|uniref:Glycosyltransferases n=1 Tax=Cuscuta australis TaxID=267555 RepID=A0A328E4M5_9ASTE|nr:hypothetical protein DM860_007692 [Cuscuta australis]